MFKNVKVKRIIKRMVFSAISLLNKISPKRGVFQMCLIQLTLSVYKTFQIHSIYLGFKPFWNKCLSTWFETRPKRDDYILLYSANGGYDIT